VGEYQLRGFTSVTRFRTFPYSIFFKIWSQKTLNLVTLGLTCILFGNEISLHILSKSFAIDLVVLGADGRRGLFLKAVPPDEACAVHQVPQIAIIRAHVQQGVPQLGLGGGVNSARAVVAVREFKDEIVFVILRRSSMQSLQKTFGLLDQRIFASLSAWQGRARIAQSWALFALPGVYLIHQTCSHILALSVRDDPFNSARRVPGIAEEGGAQLEDCEQK